MARLNKVCLLFVFVMGSLAIGSTGEAQIVRKTLQGTVGQVTRDIRETRRDYRLDKPFQYQPSDPWYRGKVFNIHTGHYGLFYNCDDEECKRNSPYICWKVHHERDFPKWKRPRYYIQQDLNRVLSRIGNGGCAPNAPCQSCADCVDGQAVENAEVSSEAIVQRDEVAPGWCRIATKRGSENGQRQEPSSATQCGCVYESAKRASIVATESRSGSPDLQLP